MKKRLVAILLASAMVVTALAGCGSKEKGDSGDNANAETNYDVESMEFDDVTITLHTRWDMSDITGVMFQDIVDDFSEKYPGIHIEQINIPTEAEYINSESVMMSDPDSMPNILLEYGGSRVAEYVKSGLVVNMDPYYEQYPEWGDSFNSLGKGLTDYSLHGIEGTYGVPWSAYQILLFYNEDILNDNGIDVKSLESWDGLMAACEKLKANGVQPFDMGEKSDYRFGHLHSVLNYKTYGCDIAEKMGTRELSYDGEEQLAIYDMMIDAYEKGYLGTNLLGNDEQQERAIFNTGQCAFLTMGTWFSGEEHKEPELFEAQKIHALRMPYVNEEFKYHDMGGGTDAYYVIDTGDPEEVAASILFLKYMTSEPVLQEFSKGYPVPMCIDFETEDGDYLMEEAKAIIAETKDVRGDIENYDEATHMVNTVRQALQSIPMGATAEEVGATIIDTIKQYE